jgi:hypothetical protein
MLTRKKIVARKSKAHEKIVSTEKIDCMAYARWADSLGLPLFHIPNEGKRSLHFGRMLKLMGLRKGVPDFFLPVMKKMYGGLFLEMKRKKDYSKSEKEKWLNQKAWIDYLNGAGYYASFAYGFEDAVKITTDYLREKL